MTHLSTELWQKFRKKKKWCGAFKCGVKRRTLNNCQPLLRNACGIAFKSKPETINQEKKDGIAKEILKKAFLDKQTQEFPVDIYVEESPQLIASNINPNS